jgi:hypothetical protein
LSWAPRSSTCDAQRGNGQGTIEYMRFTISRASSNGLGNTAKYLRGAAGISLGTTITYLRRTTRPRPGHHDQEPATQSKRRRGQRPGRYDQVPATPTSGASGSGLSRYRGLLVNLFTTSAPLRFCVCVCLRRQQTKSTLKKHVTISPTHKRAEGRAPLLGSEFTSKDDTLAPRGAWLRQKSCQEISCTVVALLVLKKCVSSDAL